jgi:hypothetical protein
MSWDTIINTGSSSWKLVEVNVPSADISSSSCNGLPDVSDWENMSAPLGTGAASSSLKRADARGNVVIDVKWLLEFEYGSRYKAGGAFIRTCWITIPTCNVQTGFDVQMRATVEDPPLNKGSATAPIALLRIHIEASVTSKAGSDQRRWLVAIRGDGAMQI